MPTIKYRSSRGIKVKNLGKVKSGKHKGEVKVKTLEAVGKRPKGSIDYRRPDKIYR